MDFLTFLRLNVTILDFVNNQGTGRYEYKRTFLLEGMIFYKRQSLCKMVECINVAMVTAMFLFPW